MSDILGTFMQYILLLRFVAVMLKKNILLAAQIRYSQA
jgi:hypothetical protein